MVGYGVFNVGVVCDSTCKKRSWSCRTVSRAPYWNVFCINTADSVAVDSYTKHLLFNCLVILYIYLFIFATDTHPVLALKLKMLWMVILLIKVVFFVFFRNITECGGQKNIYFPDKITKVFIYLFHNVIVKSTKKY